MIYKELYNDFVGLFPEDSARFQQLEEEAGVLKEEDGMYVLFDMVVVPFIREIRKGNAEKTKKAFDFIERMEVDEDPEIANVAEVSVLEALMNDPGGMKTYVEFIGPQSLEAARHMSEFYDVDPF